MHRCRWLLRCVSVAIAAREAKRNEERVKKRKMKKEILRIKCIENGKTITEFSMNFRKWRRQHRKGGGSPFVIETAPTTIDMRNRIEITLRSEEADLMIEELRKKEDEEKGKKKDEIDADRRLEQLGVMPRIYHFETHVEPFKAITIAEDRLTSAGVRRELDRILPHVRSYPHEKATRLRKALREIDIYGVAICDSQEPDMNVTRGRTIAKGRLGKHLKKIGVRKSER